jgi:hypothetical protein
VTDTPPEPPATPPAEPAEPAGGPTVDSLDARLDRLEDMIKGFFGQQPGQAETPDIKGEVRAAVREVQAADKAKADKAAEQKSLADQVAELKAEVEKAPQEYKRATQRMGWTTP